jgi:hypothetical protein
MKGIRALLIGRTRLTKQWSRQGKPETLELRAIS